MSTATLQAASASPSFFFIASTPAPIPAEIAVEQDRLPTILLVLMILLLPSIAVFVGVAVWIIRRIKAIPLPGERLTNSDIESKLCLDPRSDLDPVGFTTRRFSFRSKGKLFRSGPCAFGDDISGDTLTGSDAKIPTIRVITKSPSRDNESLDVDIEKLDMAVLPPDAMSTLPKRYKLDNDAASESDRLQGRNSARKWQDFTEIDLQEDQCGQDVALARTFSAFGISPLSSPPSAETVPLVKNSGRYPSP